VGFRPANNASNPTGKKHMETTISHTGKPPCEVIVLHLGQETTAMKISLSANQLRDPYQKQTGGSTQI
jgi:hypothetical protein